ncbi:MAG TPA: carboxypeptidase-like regulatory domain-containing protein [Longimicrobiaceae bacterium]
MRDAACFNRRPGATRCGGARRAGRNRRALLTVRMVAATVAGLACAPGIVGAQTIHGTVRDRITGDALAGATVLLTDGRDSVRAATLSTDDGTFRMRSQPGDTVRVRAERAGYGPMASRLLVLAAESSLELDVQLLPMPVALDGITVIGERQLGNRADFERRRRSEIWGRFADAERLAQVRSPRAVDRLRAFIPGMVAGADGIVRVRKRGGDLSGVPTCQPRYYIDGVRYPGDLSVDALVPGELIRAVEYYSDPQVAPAEFTMGFDAMIVTGPNLDGIVTSGPGLRRPCAIVVIWTVSGFGFDGD